MSLEELTELLEYEDCYVHCTEEWQAVNVVAYLVDSGCVVTEINDGEYDNIQEFVHDMFGMTYVNPNICVDEGVYEVVMWSTVDDHKPIEYEDFMQMIHLNDVEFDENIFNALI